MVQRSRRVWTGRWTATQGSLEAMARVRSPASRRRGRQVEASTVAGNLQTRRWPSSPTPWRAQRRSISGCSVRQVEKSGRPRHRTRRTTCLLELFGRDRPWHGLTDGDRRLARPGSLEVLDDGSLVMFEGRVEDLAVGAGQPRRVPAAHWLQPRPTPVRDGPGQGRGARVHIRRPTLSADVRPARSGRRRGCRSQTPIPSICGMAKSAQLPASSDGRSLNNRIRVYPQNWPSHLSPRRQADFCLRGAVGFP